MSRERTLEPGERQRMSPGVADAVDHLVNGWIVGVDSPLATALARLPIERARAIFYDLVGQDLIEVTLGGDAFAGTINVVYNITQDVLVAAVARLTRAN